MPEMPEVETLRRQLEKVILGQRIKKVKVLREKSFQGNPKEVEGKRIEEIGRKAKVMWWRLTGRRYVLVHLKMTGQLVYVPTSSGSSRSARSGRDDKSALKSVTDLSKTRGRWLEARVVGGHPTADWVGELPSKHTRVILELEKGILYFNDVRVFGWLKVVDEKGREKELAKYGVDVNSKEFSWQYLKKVLESSQRAIKLIILDQKKIGGLGNIYANDGLFCAGIDPRRKGIEVAENEAEVKKLWRCLRKVIRLGLKYGGASERNYVHLDGLGGKYQEHFLVYGGGKCPRCGRELTKIKLGGRSTWFCEKCQG